MISTKQYRQALRESKSARSQSEIRAVADLLEDAHRSGDPKAAYALGTWYFHGKFFKEDRKKGFLLMLEAADNFVPDACFDVAVSYETGAGIRKNIKKAVIYYFRAMMLGETQSITEVGRLFYWGIGVPKSRTIANELLHFQPNRRVD